MRYGTGWFWPSDIGIQSTSSRRLGPTRSGRFWLTLGSPTRAAICPSILMSSSVSWERFSTPSTAAENVSGRTRSGCLHDGVKRFRPRSEDRFFLASQAVRLRWSERSWTCSGRPPARWNRILLYGTRKCVLKLQFIRLNCKRLSISVLTLCRVNHASTSRETFNDSVDIDRKPIYCYDQNSENIWWGKLSVKKHCPEKYFNVLSIDWLGGGTFSN